MTTPQLLRMAPTARSNRLGAVARLIAAEPRGTAIPNLNERFASGDPEAIRTLYREFGRPLYGAVYRILNDRGLAEEAVQRTFLKAWRAADRFDPRRDIAPWLFTIAKRTAVDIYRREKRHPSEELGERDVGVESPGMESTYAVFEVRRALETLPDEERDVLTLTHFEGLSHQQAATRLGIPIGTVKSRAYRAYRRLERSLAHMREVSA